LQRNSFHQSNLNIPVADLITAVHIPTQLWYLLIYSLWETTKNTDSIYHLLVSIKLNYKRPRISSSITIKLSFKHRFITWKRNFNSDFSGYWGFKISLLSAFITLGEILHYDYTGYRTVACFRTVTYSKINICRGLYWCYGIDLLQEGTHLEYM
jgi:hypothetical protein